jgi:Zn-dependent protease
MFSGLDGFQIIIFLASLIVSLAIHEAMHAYVAHSLGDHTAHEEGRLTLNPLKHIDMMTSVLLPFMLILVHLPPIFIAKPVPFNPMNLRHGEFGVALVGIAGPFTNLALAILASMVIHAGGLAVGTPVYDALRLFLMINVSFFVFNMIPFPPLDGSRLLYAFAPDPVRRVMESIESMGFAAIIVFFLLLVTFIGPVIANITTSISFFLLR